MPRHGRQGSDGSSAPRIVYVERTSGPCDGCVGGNCLKSTWNCTATVITLFVMLTLVAGLGACMVVLYSWTRMEASNSPYWWGQWLVLALLVGTVAVILCCNALLCTLCCSRSSTREQHKFR